MSEESDRSVTRTSLLARARTRDSTAWRELVDLYGPLVGHWCHHRGLDAHATVDCVQEVFAAVSRSLGQFTPTRSSGSFRGWLWTITANKIRDHVRRDGRKGVAAGGSTALRSLHQVSDNVVDDSGEPSSDDEIQALAARGLAQIRDEFSQKTWRMFERSVIDGIDTALVAKDFAVKPATVRQAKSRVLRRLRQQLGDCDQEA